MRQFYTPRLLTIFLTILLAFTGSVVHAQDAAGRPQASEQSDDVLRIRTELVQTDVMVFDKQGRFVEGLGPEQFELSLDGKAQSISFFERVTAGSSAEAAQLVAARGGGGSSSATIKNEVNEGDRSATTEQGREEHSE